MSFARPPRLARQRAGFRTLTRQFREWDVNIAGVEDPDGIPEPEPERRSLRLRPSRTIAVFPWSATLSRWELRPGTVAILWVGLWIFGTGDALLIHARLGNTPWTVLAQGIGLHTGWSIGTLTIVIGLAVLTAWIPLRERPGFGTVSNVILIGVAIDVMGRWVPVPAQVGWRLAQAVIGIAAIGLGAAMYLSARLGPGPRDGWMTALHERSGWPIYRVRLAIEVSVLVVGWALGGDVGAATALFAVAIGHVLSLWLTVLHFVADRDGTGVNAAPEHR